MKVTEYFKYTRQRADRKTILDEWILFAIQNPIKKVVQEDGRIKLWAKIESVDKYLRVILLEDEETVHNAFFDRRFKGERNED